MLTVCKVGLYSNGYRNVYGNAKKGSRLVAISMVTILKENQGMFKDGILASNLKLLKKLVEIYDSKGN